MVKFASTAARKRVLLYNINIKDMSGEGSIVATYTGLTTTSYVVDSTMAELYYYCVQAVCEDGTSEWSDWMDVDIASEIDGIPVDNARNDGFADSEPSSGKCFDLSGHRLQHIPLRGLYIRSGKTYMAR